MVFVLFISIGNILLCVWETIVNIVHVLNLVRKIWCLESVYIFSQEASWMSLLLKQTLRRSFRTLTLGANAELTPDDAEDVEIEEYGTWIDTHMAFLK